MTPRWLKWPRRLVLVCAVLTVVSLARADAGGFVFVKNAKNPTANLSKDAAKNVFNGHTKAWSSDEAILLVIGSEDSPAMSWLATTLFGVSAKTYLAKLKQDVFKGDVLHPVSADDDAKTIKRIQAGAGIVGVITDEGAKALPRDVAVLPIQ
jgi:ABC-type phosphate transport system substrate-binding protein